MNATHLFVAALAIFLGASSVTAAEAPAGAASCSGCHATNSRAQTTVPPLKGKSPVDIADAMIAYKSGKQTGTIMDRIAKGFSDEEIRAIAAWYAEQK